MRLSSIALSMAFLAISTVSLAQESTPSIYVVKACHDAKQAELKARLDEYVAKAKSASTPQEGFRIVREEAEYSRQFLEKLANGEMCGRH